MRSRLPLPESPFHKWSQHVALYCDPLLRLCVAPPASELNAVSVFQISTSALDSTVHSSVLNSSRNSQLRAARTGGGHVVRCQTSSPPSAAVRWPASQLSLMFGSSLLRRSIGVITYILWVAFQATSRRGHLRRHKSLCSPSALFPSKAKSFSSRVPADWAALRRSWARPSRRRWPTSRPSTTTLMKSISVTPVSWQRTSYAVCWSRIRSRNLWGIF